MERKDSNREVSFDSTWALICGFSSVACALEKSESVKLSKCGGGNGGTQARHRSAVTKSLTLVWMSVLLVSTMTLAQGNPVPLISQPLVPTATAPGGSTFTLTVNGTGFVSGAVVSWNGTTLATTFVNSSQLTATVPASKIATAGTALITVSNPAPGGGTSNVLYFDVSSPASSVTVTQLQPNPISVGSFLITADFNGDGRLDLAYLDATASKVFIQVGNGDGTFRVPVTYSVGSVPQGLVAGDFNGDGRLDLAVGNTQDNTISIVLGNGDGTFKSQPPSPPLLPLNSLLRVTLTETGSLIWQQVTDSRIAATRVAFPYC
jgi:hypothetical protein